MWPSLDILVFVDGDLHLSMKLQHSRVRMRVQVEVLQTITVSWSLIQLSGLI